MLWLMVFTAFAIRMVVALCIFRAVDDTTPDNSAFGWEVGWTARSIALGHGFSSPFHAAMTGPTALVPPLYTYLLAGIFHIFGVFSTKSALAILSLNNLFSSLTCLPIFFTVRRVLNQRTAILAGWFWVFYPYSINFSNNVWDYSLTSLLFCLCFWMALRLRVQTNPLTWAGFGALYGATLLSNPSVLSIFPFLVLLALLTVRQNSSRWMIGHSLLATVALATILTPWMVRNYQVMHALFPLRDGFWSEFWAGNNGDTFKSNTASVHPADNPLEMQKYLNLGEIGYFAQQRTLALNYVTHHPSFFVVTTIRRIVRYWTGFWSFTPAYLKVEPLDIPNFFVCTAITVFMLRGLLRWWGYDRSTALYWLAVLAVFPATYYLTHSSMDYRQPIEPEILILVTVGVFGLAEPEEPAEESLESQSTFEMAGV